MGSQAVFNNIATLHQTPPRDSLSEQITTLLQHHLPPKVIAKIVKDPRLFHYMEKLLTQHSANDILGITVTSDRGQLTIKAKLSHDVKQCGVTTETDGFIHQGKCVTSRVISSESTIILDRSYIARLQHNPRPQKPVHLPVAKMDATALPPPPPPKPPKPEMSLLDRYNAIADGSHNSNTLLATQLAATEKELLREALFKPMGAIEGYETSTSCKSGDCVGSPLCVGRKLYEDFVIEGVKYMCVPCHRGS